MKSCERVMVFVEGGKQRAWCIAVFSFTYSASLSHRYTHKYTPFTTYVIYNKVNFFQVSQTFILGNPIFYF